MNNYVDLKRRIGRFLAMCGVWEYIWWGIAFWRNVVKCVDFLSCIFYYWFFKLHYFKALYKLFPCITVARIVHKNRKAYMAIILHNVIGDKFFHNIPLALTFVWRHVLNKIFINNYIVRSKLFLKLIYLIFSVIRIDGRFSPYILTYEFLIYLEKDSLS